MKKLLDFEWFSAAQVGPDPPAFGISLGDEHFPWQERQWSARPHLPESLVYAETSFAAIPGEKLGQYQDVFFML